MKPTEKAIHQPLRKTSDTDMGDAIDMLRQNLLSRQDQRGIEFEGQWTTWGEVAHFGDALVAAIDKSGCPANGRIGIVIRNRAVHAAAVVGLLAHRRSISFIYAFLPPAALAENIASLKAGVVLADNEDWPKIREAVAAVGSAGIVLDKIGEPPRSLTGLEVCHLPPSDVDVGEEGVIEMLSSGTTGAPKRIAIPLRILERAVSSAPGGESDKMPDVQVNIWPLGGVGGVCLLVGSAATGTPLVLLERFSVDKLVSAVRDYRPAALGLNPTSIAMLMDAGVPVEDMASVKVVSGGSARLDPDLQERFEERYGIPILWGLGATEFCGTIVRWTPEIRARVGNSKRGSVGLPMDGVQIRAIDPDSEQEVPRGEEGLLEVLCPAIQPDWMRTTDLVSIDPDGFVYHSGRYDGAIVRGGFKILPERVVAALRKHPAVADASVVGIPDERLGAVPVAAVELRPGSRKVSEQELIEQVRSQLPGTHVPAQLKIVDALPRTPALKVSLSDVKHMFTGQAGKMPA